MNNKKDPIEQIIVEDMLRLSRVIDEEVDKAGVDPMPLEVKERIKIKLKKQIEENERQRIYDQLSEEDRKALELGRRMLAGSDEGEKVIYHRKCRRVFVAVAAVALLVLAMGITSIGGAEKVVEMMKSIVGTRELVQVDTDEDNYIVGTDKEEEAYQIIKDTFGVDPVKPIDWPKDTTFVTAEIDSELQTAVFIYEVDGNNTNYFISSHHTGSSWGVDVEDEVTDSYYVDSIVGKLEVKEYKTLESGKKSYATRFTYQGLEYYLIGVMERKDFNHLVKNLKFF